ncbi:hypothetical protein BDF22DRAFT_128815 [Syncephalis plumigaleata]|nr:hypothetical protein BDF22DRAFT_128815 [Syncephalis plumigaleata]
MLSSANLMIICEGINVREMRVRVSAQDQPPASMETTDKQQQQQQTRSPSSHGSPSRSNGAIHRNRLPEVKELAIQATNKENNKLETRRLRSNTVTTNGQLSHQLHKQKQQQHANGNAWYDGVDGADSRLFDNNPMDIAKQTTWPMKQEPNLVTDINNDINRAVTGMTANTTNTQFTQATTSYQQQQHQHQQHSLSANMITIDSDSSRRADAAIIMQGPIKLRFPDTAISDECQLRLRLCNPTQAPMRIHTRCEVEPQGGSLPVSFTCPVSGVYIHPRSYVIVPIIFRPTVVGRHRGQAIIRVSGGSHRIQVQLQGTAVTSNWIT